MELLQNKNAMTSLELVEQINIFRKKGGIKNELLHKNLLSIIRDEFEEEIAGLKIQSSGYKDRSGKTNIMFVLTLSQAKQVLVRESKIVRKSVIAYIEKLEQALIASKNEKIIPQSTDEILLYMLQSRIEDKKILEQQSHDLAIIKEKIDKLEENRQQSLLELNQIKGSTEVVPEIGIRLKINQIVRAYSEKTDIAYRDIWNKMYSLMLYTYRFNVNSYKRIHPNESKLDIIEREGQLDNLYALVSKELL